MRHIYGMILASTMTLGLLPMASHSATSEDFKVQTAQELVDLCSVPQGDPMYEAARAFCYGFIAGAYQYDQSIHAGADSKPLICLTDPKPTRAEAAAMFIRWAKDNSQYLTERPVDTLFRFGVATWPCSVSSR